MTIVRDNSYILTSDDLCEGRNKLGMDVSHIPLDVELCQGCDHPIPDDRYCARCDCKHQLTSVVGDPLFPLGNETLPNAVNWQDFARSGKAA